MGNTSQLDDSKSEPQPEASASNAEGGANGIANGATNDSANTSANVDEVAEQPDAIATKNANPVELSDDGSFELSRANTKSSPSLPPSDARPASRRSSLRPAPPSFKPSTRDPSQLLRPAMVVHAGDVDADVPIWDIAEPAPSQTSQAAWDAPRPEPFALADDFSQNGVPAAAPPNASAPVAEAPKVRKESQAATTNAIADNGSAAPKSTRAPVDKDDASAKSTRAAVEHGQASAKSKQAATTGTASVKPTTAQRAGRNTLSHFGAPNRDSKPHHAVPASSPSDASSNRAESRSNPPGRRLANAHVAAIVAAILFAGVIVAMMVGRTNTEATNAPSASTTRSEQVLPAEVHPSVAAAQLAAAQLAASADSVASAAATVGDHEAHAALPSASSAPEAAASADTVDPNSTRVTLEVVPADARVIQQGRLQPPPYVFDVPKGKKISLELARFGFVTQKVVLDGKKPLVKIGLRRAPNVRGAIN